MALVELDELQEGKLISRENRFVAKVELDGKEVVAYVPNPGRMEELMLPKTKVYLAHYPNTNRKTEYSLLLVKYNNTLVSIDSHLTNKIVEKSLLEEDLEEFTGYSEIKGEYSYGKSRLDFFLKNGEEKCLVEVKSATLVENGVAKFPDAPTKRGRRHLDELIKAKKEGYRVGVIFIIQRDDAYKFIPHQRIDLKFAEKLKEAIEKGVEVYAYNCNISKKAVELNHRVDVEI
ncbi:DNA/RNA nuclease SfsA [Orenia marismortui]|uniref:DNA/RNA nuclease SfsA n=1 Tax=Orenia marismortui TaxID=46469 RepID=UPI00035C8374|nr:DNA/RNA nuclease SfsA [Orenia marismortui]